MAESFDPSAYPALAELPERLRELAGDSAFQAGREYFRGGLVKQGAIGGTVGYATVTGSTDYRVSVAFAQEIKVSCTCPAHRRNKFCKHVVAVCTALIERPADFALVDPAPEVQSPKAPRRSKTAGGGNGKAPTSELRSAGLETVDRLLQELAGGGLLTLGPDRTALLAAAGDLVRGLKLRRLGNLVLALQRAATREAQPLEASDFASVVMDLHLTRQTTAAHLEGRIALDPQVAEDLLGKTWREEDLEAVGGLDLVELAYIATDDGKFRIETSYLADLETGAILAEKQIAPLRLSAAPKPRHRHRLQVDEAGLYPGVSPRRIRLKRVMRRVLTAQDVDGLLDRAPRSVAELRRRLVERTQVPFGPFEVAVLFRPSAIVMQADLIGAIDDEGRFLAVDWPVGWSEALPPLLPESGRYGVFGLLSLGDRGLRIRCLSVVGSALRWGRGPIYPDT